MFSNTGVNGFLRVLQQASPSKKKPFFSIFIKRVLPSLPNWQAGNPESPGVWGLQGDNTASASIKCRTVREAPPASSQIIKEQKRITDRGPVLSTSHFILPATQ